MSGGRGSARPEAPSGEVGHIAALDGVRATSILLVLGAHMLPLGPSWLGFNYAAGTGGMSLFFVLSGFLITSFLIARQDVVDFLARRIGRIAPAMILYVVVMFLILDFDPRTVVSALLFVLNYDDEAIIEGAAHLWSLCVEMQFYFAAAGLVLLFGKRGLLALPVLAIVVTALRVVDGAEASIRTHARIDEILAGATLALLYRREIPGWSRIERALGAGFWPLLVLWGLSCLDQMDPLQYLRPYTAAALVGAIIARPRDFVTAFLESAPMRYVATISYALYIWHAGFLLFGLNEGPKLEKYLFKRPISFALSFAAAHVSTFYFEKPILARVKKLLAARRDRAAPSGPAASP